MKVQDINTPRGVRYILLDNEYKPIDAVKRYLKFLDNTGKSPNTLKNYAYHLKTYFEYLSIIDTSYDELNTEEGKSGLELFSDFIAWLQYPSYLDGNVVPITPQETERSNKTVNIIMNTVLGFYDYLAKNNELKELDLYKIQRGNSKFKSFLYELVGNKKLIKKSILKKVIDEPELEYLTREEYNLIFSFCNNTRDKIIVSLMFEGGLRLGEVLGMHIEDVDIWDNKIYITPRENLENGARVKNQAKGTIFLPDYVMDLLSDYILNELDEYDTDFLLVNLRGKNKGKPMKHILNYQDEMINNIGKIDNMEPLSEEDKCLIPLPNGLCGKPISDGKCSHANACYSCRMFKANPKYLDLYKFHLKEAQQNIKIAEINGFERILQVNKELESNLLKIISKIESMK